MAPAPSFFRAFVDALRAVVGDKAVLMLLVGAPVLYGFFYPWFYGNEVVQRVPVAVVQHDGSGLARQMLRFAQASPRIEVALVTGDEAQAQQALLDGRVLGYALLPRDLKRRVVRSEEAVVPVYANGAYPLAAKQVQYGFAEAFGTVSAGVELRRLTAGGQSALQAQASRSPVNLQMQALFNPTEGYGSFVVAAVALIILQQTLLMGGALLVGTWREQGRDGAPARTWLARLLALCTLGWLSGLYYFGWIFVWHDYPRGGNPWGGAGAAGRLRARRGGAGGAAGLVAGQPRARHAGRAVHLHPLAFVGGFSWPAEALPQLLQALRWLSPSTAAIQASLRLNQAGAPLEAAAWHLSMLLALALVAWVAVLWLGSRRAGLPRSHPDARQNK
jgi:ABC-2 type transport system permease protein